LKIKGKKKETNDGKLWVSLWIWNHVMYMSLMKNVHFAKH